MKKLILSLLIICFSCAGSNFAVKQNELAKRQKNGQRNLILKNSMGLKR